MHNLSSVISSQVPEPKQLENKTVYRSNPPRKFFTVLKNSTLRKKFPSKNKSLSFMAKAIFLEALTHDPSFIFTSNSLAKIHGISKRQAKNACNLLIEHGHARRLQVFEKGTGKILRRQYVFYEDKYKEGQPPLGRQTDTIGDVSNMTKKCHVDREQGPCTTENHVTEKRNMDSDPKNPREPGPKVPKNHVTEKRNMDTYSSKKKQKEETTTAEQPKKQEQSPKPKQKKDVVVLSDKIKKIIRRDMSACIGIITQALKTFTEKGVIAQISYVNELDDKDRRDNYPGAIKAAFKANNGKGYKIPTTNTKKDLTPQEMSKKLADERKEREMQDAKEEQPIEYVYRDTIKKKKKHTKKKSIETLKTYTFKAILGDPNHELFDAVNNGTGKIEDIDGFSEWMETYKQEFEKKAMN